MIKSITLKREFHPFAEGESFNFKPITMLVGDQGAGKSTLLDLILKYEKPRLAEVNARYNKDGSSDKKRGSYNPDMTTSENNMVDISSDGELILCYVDTEKHNLRMTRGETTKEYKDAMIEILRDESLYKLIQVMEGYKTTAQWSDKKETLDGITNNLLEKLGTYFDSKRGGTILGDEMETDITAAAIATMQSHGQSIFPLIHDTMKGSNGRVILIDEPETALSIRSQHRMCGILYELSKSNQLIIATHSPILMGLSDEVLSLEHKKWMNRIEFLDTQKQFN